MSSSAGRPFGVNAGSFADASIESVNAAAAAAAEGIAQAMARVTERQAASAAFMAQHGAEVVNGHTPVGTIPPVLNGADNGGLGSSPQ
jgi:hypothetical protein